MSHYTSPRVLIGYGFICIEDLGVWVLCGISSYGCVGLRVRCLGDLAVGCLLFQVEPVFVVLHVNRAVIRGCRVELGIMAGCHRIVNT